MVGHVTTPLIFAISQRKNYVALLLIEHKADVNMADKSGMLPLNACDEYYSDFRKELISKGAMESQEYIEYRDKLQVEKAYAKLKERRYLKQNKRQIEENNTRDSEYKDELHRKTKELSTKAQRAFNRIKRERPSYHRYLYEGGSKKRKYKLHKNKTYKKPRSQKKKQTKKISSSKKTRSKK
jgi:ankyrin repeat protein